MRDAVKSGVVALRIAARPDAIWVCAHTISRKGIALFNTPMTRNADQGSLAKTLVAPIRATSNNTTAASPTRTVTTVIVGSSRTAMSLKKNEPPQSNDKLINISPSAPDITLLMPDDRVIPS